VDRCENSCHGGGKELESVKRFNSLAREDRVTAVAWNRGVREEVEQSLNIGFRSIHIGLPTSELHLKSSIRKTGGWVLSKAVELVKMAKDRGSFVSISAEDVGRTETD